MQDLKLYNTLINLLLLIIFKINFYLNYNPHQSSNRDQFHKDLWDYYIIKKLKKKF